MSRQLLFFLIIFTTVSVSGQYFSTGQDPAATRWMQIRTPRYCIVYPEQNADQAQYLARVLDVAIPAETLTLKARVPCIPILLHTSSTLSNGVTTWAPRRIELYTCPPQDTYPEEWLEQLAIHEYRHAVQISKMNRGFTKALYYILGEQATGAMLGLFLPPWFLEGDATCTETALTLTGRGRMPSFSSQLRAQVIEKGIYSYDKATLGSYKTFIPDSYVLGYHLVAAGRVRYGVDLWNHAVDRSARYPFMIVPFASGIKQKTGLSKANFYRSSLSYFDSIWSIQAQRTTCSQFHPVTHPDPRNYTEFDHPVHVNDSLFVAAKFSNEEPDCMVIVDRNGTEKPLFRLGNYQEESHSASGKWICWAETNPHIRWQNKDYSVVRLFDLEQRKVKTLTHRTRYFSPVISPDGTRIAAVHIDDQNRCRLDLLNLQNGRVIRSYPAPEYSLIIAPAWSPDGKQLTMTLLTEKGKSIVVADLASGTFRTELPPTYRDISGPSFFFRNFLIFTADYTGIDNLYAIDTLTGAISQVTSSKYASGDPDFSSDEEWMIYSEMTADGLMIAEKKTDPEEWVPVDRIYALSYNLAEKLSAQENVNVQQDIIDHGLTRWLNPGICDTLRPLYPEKHYRRGLTLFNPHSWAPVSVDADNMSLSPGVCILSQNTLSSAFAGAGYTWDLNERTGKVYLNFRYEGWYPVIDFRAGYGKRAGIARYQSSSETFRFTWNETDLDLNISLPLNLSGGAWYRYLRPQAGLEMMYVAHDKTTPSAFTLGWIATLNYRLSYSQFIHSNYQDVYPQWGQVLDICYQHSPLTTNDPGSLFSGQMTLYFPGILKHQGIRLYSGYQKRLYQTVHGYSYPSLVTYPRGVTDAFDDDLISLSAGYKFPFLRLDLSMGSIIYFKRFKLNLFYDWAQGSGKGYRNDYQSVGAELTSDLHLLRFYAPIELGIRGYYLPGTNKVGFEFLYGISF